MTKSKKEKRKGRDMEMEAGAVRKMPNTEYSTSRDNTKDKHSTKGVDSFTNSIGQIVEFASYEKKCMSLPEVENDRVSTYQM